LNINECYYFYNVAPKSTKLSDFICK